MKNKKVLGKKRDSQSSLNFERESCIYIDRNLKKKFFPFAVTSVD